jgi:hypothetical protein
MAELSAIGGSNLLSILDTHRRRIFFFPYQGMQHNSQNGRSTQLNKIDKYFTTDNASTEINIRPHKKKKLVIVPARA